MEAFTENKNVCFFLFFCLRLYGIVKNIYQFHSRTLSFIGKNIECFPFDVRVLLCYLYLI